MTAWIQTHTAKAYYPAEPDPRLVDIDDIARALSMQCRYGGHVERFYSVAEHSVHVSRLVPAPYALTALLHDATEAYLVDVPRPVKALLDGYHEIEHRNWLAIATHFGLPATIPPCVHDADVLMLYAERAQLLKPMPAANDWGPPRPGPVPNVGYLGLPPDEAETIFIERFNGLYAVSLKSTV